MKPNEVLKKELLVDMIYPYLARFNQYLDKITLK